MTEPSPVPTDWDMRQDIAEDVLAYEMDGNPAILTQKMALACARRAVFAEALLARLVAAEEGRDDVYAVAEVTRTYLARLPKE